MSSGKTHAKVTKLLSVPSGIAIMILLPDGIWMDGVACVIGCLTGLIIEPDLDVDTITTSEWKMVKRFWIFGMVWVTFWYPYAKLIPHRNPLSHFPIVGTLGRLFYLILISVFIGYMFDLQVDEMMMNIEVVFNHRLFAVWVIGLMVADTGHCVADIGSSAYKRKKRIGKRKKIVEKRKRSKS